MNETISEARHLVSEMVPGLQAIDGVDKVLCPPFTDLLAVSALLQGTDIGLGAQTMHWENSGAFTGEISPLMVAELCDYVILGHSERRTYFGETDETVNRKVKAALANNLIPILCVGETLEQYEAGQTRDVVLRQVRLDLEGVELTSGDDIVIAYEPIWAIGTGKASTPEDAEQVIGGVVRSALADLFGMDLANDIRILYGGSVKPNNAADFFSEQDIDGALVGGASLKVGDFTQIVQAAANVAVK